MGGRKCRECGQQTGPSRRLCKMCSLEKRYDTPAEKTRPDRWVLGDHDSIWHAADEFDGRNHTCLCGANTETPLEWSAEDLRYAPERYEDTPVCRECVARLEGRRAETIPEDATFERASELAVPADGEEVDR